MRTYRFQALNKRTKVSIPAKNKSQAIFELKKMVGPRAAMKYSLTNVARNRKGSWTKRENQ